MAIILHGLCHRFECWGLALFCRLVAAYPHNVAPTWSPDGEWIVFLSNRTGEWALQVMQGDGSNQQQLSVDLPIEYSYQAEQVVSWGP
jgi:hypothetical protein